MRIVSQMSRSQLRKEQLYVYSLSEELIGSLELVRFSTYNEYLKLIETEKNQERKELSELDDFARYNLLRQKKGLPTITEEQFDDLLEAGSVESLSGTEELESESDSESDIYSRLEEISISDITISNHLDHLNTKSPYIYFKTSQLGEDENLGIYKALLGEDLENPLRVLNAWQSPEIRTGKSALFMIGGGHFAGAIISHELKNVKGNNNHKESLEEQKVNILKSKTFHRYTTRRKQGGSQLSNDNSKGKAKSVGSNMRRENERLLIQEVQELLKSWESDLSQCQSIFIRAHGSSYKTIVNGNVLKVGDKRIKKFPFTTKRPTNLELKKAWVKLLYLSIETIVSDNNRQIEKQLQQQELLKKSIQRNEKAKIELTEDDIHTQELIQFIKKSKAPMLISYLRSKNLTPNFRLTPAHQYVQVPTLLHYTSSQGLTHMIQTLLVNLKADISIKNQAGRYAPELSMNLATRQMFQICRYKLGEDYCNWDEYKVGPGQSKEEFQRLEQEEQNRIKLEKQQRIKDELAKKTQMELKEPKFSSKGKVGGHLNETAGLSDAQRLMVMREQRARAAEARLKMR